MSENTTGISTVKDNSVKALMARPDVIKKFQEILGKKAQTFATSVIQIVNSNELLKNAEPMSILNCAMVAATLDLPLNNQIGFAWIVPFKKNSKNPDGSWNSTVVAQFQIGYRGFNQLALRTAEYKAINCIPVYENQFKSFNSLTEELDADFSVDGTGNVVGYCAYFRLVNGFEKTVFWSRAKAEAHGKKYSKSFTSGPWKDDFDSMAVKTVLKNTLAKWGILSVEMQKAIQVDQGLINDEDGTDVTYIDNEPEVSDSNTEFDRAMRFIEVATTLPELEDIEKKSGPELLDQIRPALNEKRESILSMQP